MRTHEVVFVVQHTHLLGDDEEDIKLIGIYATRDAAQSAVMGLKLKPGFRDVPEGFSVEPYVLDEDHWTEGYVTLGKPGDDRRNSG